MASPDLLAGVMLAALIVYALSGGADFGGGVWDLLARGPRAAEHRRLIEGALAPVWEANHVWLIFVVVVLFTAFPAAFAALATRQHGMLTVVLLGIVLRGSALVFRQYGGGAGAARWGAVFAAASAVTPFFLGLVLAGVTAGGGTAPFALALGALAVCLCAFLAAVYLGVEARDRAPELEADLRRRAVGAWIAVAVTAAATGATATTGAPRFAARLFDSSFSPPLLIAVALAAGGALAALLARRPRTARVLAVVEVALLVLGWGAAHHPLLVAPDIDLASAAAPRATLELLVPVLAIGAAVVLPPFYWLLRVFKGQRTP